MSTNTECKSSAAATYTLSSSELRVRLTNLGGRLLEVEYKGIDRLYGPKTEEELQQDTCYCGAICGRVANRIAGGTFELGGKEYKLAVNNGPNHLHGGLCGFSDRCWEVESATDSSLVLSLVSPDGEEGYPGTVHLRATYTVCGSSLTLVLEGTTDAPTLLNLTNHAYWNLNGKGTVDAHLLQVKAATYTPMVANIPTGEIAPVEGTLYDLNAPASLGVRYAAFAQLAGGEGPTCGYDDNYVLGTGGTLCVVATLTNGDCTLTLATDAPGLQVYTGDYLPLPRGGVALEAQNYPDSPHNAHFPSIELAPGVLYKRTIVWQFS